MKLLSLFVAALSLTVMAGCASLKPTLLGKHDVGLASDVRYLTRMKHVDSFPYTTLSVQGEAYELETMVWLIDGDRVWVETRSTLGNVEDYLCSSAAGCSYIVSVK